MEDRTMIVRLNEAIVGRVTRCDRTTTEEDAIRLVRHYSHNREWTQPVWSDDEESFRFAGADGVDEVIVTSKEE